LNLLKAFFRKRDVGFVFVPDVDEGAMKRAAAGATIGNPDSRPPWIVVDRSLESVVVAKWPGKLWRVEVLRRAPEQPLAGAHYTRAVSVRVIEELPVSTLFGPHGDLVCRVIEKAGALSLDDLHRLGKADPAARQAYSRAWGRWLGSGDDHADTLAVVASGTAGRSPIGSGFTVLHAVFSERARKLAGQSAFVSDDEGNVSLAPVWAEAAEAFLHAAMGYGAPEILSPGDAEVLTVAMSGGFT
jgi:hypothetical protein